MAVTFKLWWDLDGKHVRYALTSHPRPELGLVRTHGKESTVEAATVAAQAICDEWERLLAALDL